MIRVIFLSTVVWLSLFAVQRVVAQQSDTAIVAPQVPEQRLSEKQKIEQLILYISNLQGATFIRNGNKYSPQEAAKHLASKFNKHAKKIKTAHDFIDHLASKSSVSGDLYQIRMPDGTMVETQKLLNLELQRIEVQGFTQ